MKYSGLVLFACAGLLLSGGVILGGSVAWGLLRMSYYFWTTDVGVELSSTVLFLAAALLCLPSCWLATLVPHHPKSVILHGLLISLVSVALVLLSLGLTSVAGLARAVRDPAMLNSSMLRALTLDAFDPAIRSSFAAMQVELKCCGVQSYSDWYHHRHTLPPACCGRMFTAKLSEVCEKPIYNVGCLRPALAELRYYANSLSALSSALVIVMAVTLLTAAYALVWTAVERNDLRNDKLLQTLRVACLSHSQPPLVSLTAPAALPHGDI